MRILHNCTLSQASVVNLATSTTSNNKKSNAGAIAGAVCWRCSTLVVTYLYKKKYTKSNQKTVTVTVDRETLTPIGHRISVTTSSTTLNPIIVVK